MKNVAKFTDCVKIHFVTRKDVNFFMKYKKRHLMAAIFSAFTLISGQALAISVDNLMQIVPKDSATDKTISWQADDDRSDYSVQYRQKGSSDVKEAYVTEGKRPPIYDADNPAPYTYGAYMQKLTPATDYEYRIVDSDGATGWFPFTTTKENVNNYKVLIFGDSQSTDYGVWGQTANIAWQQNQDAAFFVNMGDITDNGQAYFQWRAWFDNADVLTSHIPFAPVMGNHEAYSMDWQFAEPYTYKALFAVPYGGPKDQNRMAYSFDYGDVHYVSLNTDEEELGSWRPTMMQDEAAWLDKDLAAAQKAGKRLIVMMHRPPWNSPYDGNLDVNGKYFMPLFDKYNVPLVFTAHEHCYERTVPIKNDQAADNGTIYIATGRSGTEAWDGSVKKPTDVIYYNPTDMPMYLTLQVEPDAFRVSAMKNDGTLIDSVSIPAKAQQAEAPAAEVKSDTAAAAPKEMKKKNVKKHKTKVNKNKQK